MLSKWIFGLVLLIASGSAFAQTINCNGAQGTVAIPGTALSVNCPTSTAVPPPVIPPPVAPPSSGCADSQLSSPVSGKTFKRQCSGVVYMLPTSNTYTGPLTDLGTVLGGKPFPTYSYSGSSPTIQIQSGYYVALAFTPNATGSFQLSADPSFGDGGTIAVSTVPGGIVRGAPNVICALPYNASNGITVSASSPVCPVTAGKTYYVNFADTDLYGTQLCYGGSPGSCASSVVSYTLYTSK